MSAMLRAGGYGHRIVRLGYDEYELRWTVDYKHRRLRYPKTTRRETDKKGAERFAKKWKCAMPPEPTDP